MAQSTHGKVSIQSSQRGFTVEFDDYFISVVCTEHSTKAYDAAYAACRRIARSVEFVERVDYNELTAWAVATVKLQNSEDAEYMTDDVWGWYPCWSDCADRAFGSEFAKFALYPDHFNHRVSGGIEFKANHFDCDGYRVEVRRVHCDD